MMNDTHTVDAPIAALTASQRKRRQVMEAAARLFMAQGYGATSMDAVARKAGVSKATLYAYFQGKDALFAAIVGEACQRHAEGRPCCPTGNESDLAGALIALGEGYLSFLFREDVMAIQRVVLAEGPRFPELGRAFYESGPRRMIQWVAGWFAGLQRQGRLRLGDPAVAAEQFLALHRGSALMRRMLGVPPAPDAAEIQAIVSAAVDTFLRAWGVGRET
jgi:TetR/AcrR family transcriptional repressor of mexJK operon